MNGFDGLDSLIKLSLRSNTVSSWEEAFPPIESLEYLNLRSTKVEKMEEIEKLASLPKLKTLILSFNPFIEKNQSSYFYQILHKFNYLERINKHVVTRTVRQKTMNYQEQLSKERREAEEEAKRKEEEEANKDNAD